MQIPTSIKIGGIRYDIAVVDQISGAPARIGEIDTAYTKIQLRKTQADDSMKASFLHEVIHGIFYALGKENGGDEELVEGIAQILYQVIVDNPDVFK